MRGCWEMSYVLTKGFCILIIPRNYYGIFCIPYTTMGGKNAFVWKSNLITPKNFTLRTTLKFKPESLSESISQYPSVCQCLQ